MDYEYHNAETLTSREEAGMKAALLVSTGVLMGLGLRNKFLRRVAGMACAALAAGIAIPLAQEYLEQKRDEGDGDQVDIWVEAEDAPKEECVSPEEAAPAEPAQPVGE